MLALVLSLLRQRNFWGIALPRFLADPTWGTLTFWMPLYLNSVRHFDLKQIALFAWLPFVAAHYVATTGDAVVVFAQGPIGLCATAGAKLMGATTIIAVDRVPERLARVEAFTAWLHARVRAECPGLASAGLVGAAVTRAACMVTMRAASSTAWPS